MPDVHRGGQRLYYKQNMLQQLRGFYHVAVTRSFTTAAEVMALGQSSVTLQVQALERELEVKLFHRRKGTTTLTLEGELLFELIAPLVESLESLQEAFRERLGQFESGKVVCAATEGVVLYMLPDVIRPFASRFPNIELQFYSGTSLQALEMVTRGVADLGIGLPARVPSNIAFQPLMSYDHYLVVPRGHPLLGQADVSLEDMVKYPLIAPPEEGALWHDLRQMLETHRLDWQVVTRVGIAGARFRYVQLGFGVTVAIGIGFETGAPLGLASISLAGILPRATYGLMTRKNTYLSLPAKKFADFVLSSTGLPNSK